MCHVGEMFEKMQMIPLRLDMTSDISVHFVGCYVFGNGTVRWDCRSSKVKRSDAHQGGDMLLEFSWMGPQKRRTEE